MWIAEIAMHQFLNVGREAASQITQDRNGPEQWFGAISGASTTSRNVWVGREVGN